MMFRLLLYQPLNWRHIPSLQKQVPLQTNPGQFPPRYVPVNKTPIHHIISIIVPQICAAAKVAVEVDTLIAAMSNRNYRVKTKHSMYAT